MSLFQDDNLELQKSIEYFNSLDEERKAIIVSNLTGEKWTSEEQNNVIPIISAILNDMSRYSLAMLVSQTVELGMEETYATLFVKKIIKDAPTTEYQLKVLSKIDDEQFKKLFPDVLNAWWIEQDETDVIKKNIDISDDEFQAMVSIIRDGMNGLARRTTSVKKISSECKKNNFSDSKIEVVLNTFKIYSEVWRKMYVFSNIQDVYIDSTELRKQNYEILNIVRELLVISKQNLQEKSE